LISHRNKVKFYAKIQISFRIFEKKFKFREMMLVTGATGFLGGHLLWQLLQKHESVVAICRSSSNLKSLETIFRFYTSTPTEVLSKVEWRVADLNNASTLELALEGIRVVYHCGAVVSLGGTTDTILDTNVIGTRNLVNASLKLGIEQFCFVSSIAACGRVSGASFIDEKTPWVEDSSRSLYSQSKYSAEQEVWYGIQKGLKAVIVNPGVILGPFGKESGSAQLFLQVRKGLKFYTRGGTGYVDVRDVVKVMIQLVENNIYAERFVLVGENCSHKELLYWMADGYGKPRLFIPMGKAVLYLIGSFAELFGKVFHFQPFIDRGTARSACNRSFYSNLKVMKALDFQFSPIKQCVQEVCEFDLQNQK
jgi:dihydroflavonol-4-reductase